MAKPPTLWINDGHGRAHKDLSAPTNASGVLIDIT